MNVLHAAVKKKHLVFSGEEKEQTKSFPLPKTESEEAQDFLKKQKKQSLFCSLYPCNSYPCGLEKISFNHLDYPFLILNLQSAGHQGHLSEYILKAAILTPTLGELVKEEARVSQENPLACIK